MAFFRFVIWTGVCVAFGVFLGTCDLGGRTPWKAMQSAWKAQSPAVVDTVNGVKKKLGTTEKAEPGAVTTAASGPRESHTQDDKKAIDQLINKRAN
jgi:hypothetical protein